jgi:hypothetical protein
LTPPIANPSSIGATTGAFGSSRNQVTGEFAVGFGALFAPNQLGVVAACMVGASLCQATWYCATNVETRSSAAVTTSSDCGSNTSDSFSVRKASLARSSAGVSVVATKIAPATTAAERAIDRHASQMRRVP